MPHLRMKRLFIVSSVAVLCSIGYVNAQPKLQMTETDFKLNKNAAIPHRAFEAKDPKTGKLLKAGDMITLSNGQRVNGLDYIAKLNKLEANLNAIGHTVRNKASHTVLHDAIIPHEELKTHSAAIAKAHLAFQAGTMKAALSHEVVAQQHALAVKTDAARLNQLAQVAPGSKKVDYVKNWHNQIGKQSLVAGFLDGKFEFHGNSDRVKVNAEASAGGYLMNHKITLLAAKGAVDSPKTGNSRATLNVLVKGQSILNLDKSFPTTFSETKRLSKSFDYGTTFHFSVGPIPIGGKIGVRGSAGVDFVFGVRQLHANMHVKPHIDSKVYAQAGVDVGIASAGVGGQLTLLKDELDIGAEVGIDFDSKGVYLSEHIYAKNKLEMLSGNFYVYARVDYFIGHSEWRTNIWNWQGLRSNGYLFNVANKTYLATNTASATSTAQK